MLSSIHPFGERSRQNRWGFTAAAHILGSALGGLALGLLAGGLGRVAEAIVGRWPLVVLVALVALAGAAVDSSIASARGPAWIPSKVPSWHRQVNEHWIGTYRGWVYGAGFGVQLGFGFATIVTSAVVFLVVPVAMLTSSVTGGAIIGSAFGLFRGASVLAMAGADDPSALKDRFATLDRLSRPAIGAAVATQFSIGLVAVLALAGPFGAAL